MREVKGFINGEFVSSGEFGDIYSPTTGELVCKYHKTSIAQVDEAVQAAKTALKGPWADFSIQQRVEILYKIADGIDARFDEFLAAECLDTGKPYSLASHIDIP
ncbi:MAG: aldehyde dehydrogenase family protein, partial [Cycloclasticus sp.]|nr:aldehyde dehydrogenase family protein [Cycloclasticus sp.]